MNNLALAVFLSWNGRAILFAVIAGVAAYLIGNISPAILIGKMAGLDIRSQGSGNAGTTNVLRVLGKKAAAMTLLIDIFKGVAAVALGRAVAVWFLGAEYSHAFATLCTVAVFAGHIWPVVFGFRGGKGIATGFGAIVTLQPAIGISLAVIAILGIVLSRRVSVGSVAAAVLLPFLAYRLQPEYLLCLTVMALIVLYKHRANIKRLLKGEEPKLNFKK